MTATALTELLDAMAAGLYRSTAACGHKVADALVAAMAQAGPVSKADTPAIISPDQQAQILKSCQQGESDLHHKIKNAAPQLAWRRPGFGRIPNHIAKRLAVCEIIGPSGQIANIHVRAGLLFQEAGTIYPRHSHAAEEIYFALSGPVYWQTNGDSWQARNSGAFIHHAPYQPHAIQTKDIPLIAVWGWTGDIRSDSYDI